MKITSVIKNIVVIMVACSLCIVGGLAMAGQQNTVYAGSHSNQLDGDVGSISVNNKAVVRTSKKIK